jgi:hypothetical protein
MKKRYVISALALVVALCFALPAVGASPANLATKALGLAKKADKRAKKANRTAKSAQTSANSAQSAADGARSAAGGAQATANSARSQASAAQSTASAAASAANEARTSARQVHRDGGEDIPGSTTETVATMTGVGPGAYVIMAKTDVFDASNTVNGIVQCRVNAGADSDFANTRIGPGAGDFEDTLQANTVHTFVTAGTVTLQCTNNMPGTGTITAQQTKIIAIKVGNIAGNSAVTG